MCPARLGHPQRIRELLSASRDAPPHPVRGRRDFAGILFSSATECRTFRFPAGQPPRIGDVLDFAEFFYGGGTDFQAPLNAAVDLLETQYDHDGKQRGDIVLITDGACDVSEDWTHAWNDRKHRLGFRLFGIAIGMDDMFDLLLADP